jgi:hypothetical protein
MGGIGARRVVEALAGRGLPGKGGNNNTVEGCCNLRKGYRPGIKIVLINLADGLAGYFYGEDSLVRGSARFSSDRIHRTKVGVRPIAFVEMAAALRGII